MKSYIFLVMSFLLIGQLTLSDDTPAQTSVDPNIDISKPKDPTTTEATQTTPTVCVACGGGVQNPVPQVEQLVINWDKINETYGYQLLSPEDQKEILKKLTPADYETLAQRTNRQLKLQAQKKDPTNPTTEALKNLAEKNQSGVKGTVIKLPSASGKPTKPAVGAGIEKKW